jgi:hypothetical protein
MQEQIRWLYPFPARDFAIALFELIFKVLPPLKKNSLL